MDHDDGTFETAFREARNALNPDHFSPEWRGLVQQLKAAMTDQGFHPGRAGLLALLDSRLKTPLRGERPAYDDGWISPDVAGQIHHLASAIPDLLPALSGGRVRDLGRVADQLGAFVLLKSVKLLRHAGARQAWLVSLPDAFTLWPADAFKSVAPDRWTQLLDDSRDRQLSPLQHEAIADACSLALQWCQRAVYELSWAPHRQQARFYVEQWFTGPHADERESLDLMQYLQYQFKRMVSALAEGNVIFVHDHPFHRRCSRDSCFCGVGHAFVSLAESLRVVNLANLPVESSFHAMPLRSCLALVIVHELSHSIAKTRDFSYGWEFGLKPYGQYRLTADECRDNADNWAYFAAHCSWHLSQAEYQHVWR